MSPREEVVKSVVSYGFLTVAALALLWVAFEFRYMQGLSAAQGGHAFYYPYLELLVATLALAAGFAVVRTRAWPMAIPTAVLIMLAAYIYWLRMVG